MLKAQEILKGTISDGLASVTAANNDLATVASLPALGSDSVSAVATQTFTTMY